MIEVQSFLVSSYMGPYPTLPRPLQLAEIAD
jgi:hypothetical protein